MAADYHARIHAVEQTHWWHRGMRAITEALLCERLARPGQRLLDAGCGTGGFLAWALDLGAFAHASGIDASPAAIELARRRVPRAQLAVAPLHAVPHSDATFHVVAVNDVLQHVHEAVLAASVGELRRVLRDDGTLLVRTNGALRARREREDWRVYDRDGLRAALAEAGLTCERITYASLVPSLWAAARGSFPRAPSREAGDGIPAQGGAIAGRAGEALMRAEASYLAGRTGTLPYGHTLFALACAGGPGPQPPSSDTRASVPAER